MITFLLKVSDDIPEERIEKILNTFLSCDIGREVAYYHGISPSAEEYYDKFFGILSKKQVVKMLNLLKNHLDSIFNGAGIRCNKAAAILKMVKSPLC